MSKAKDLRNGREQGNWKPGRWSPARARLEVRHARTYAYATVEVIAPESIRCSIQASVRTEFDVALSKLGILERYGPDRLKELYPNG